MTTYTTVQGDTWDAIAYRLYGDHNAVSVLTAANQPLIDWLVFPAGVELNVPDLPETVDERLPFWRRQ